MAREDLMRPRRFGDVPPEGPTPKPGMKRIIERTPIIPTRQAVLDQQRRRRERLERRGPRPEQMR